MSFKIILVSLLLCFSAFAQEESSYQEEFVFLNQQLSALKARKSQTLSKLKTMKSKMEGELYSLEKSVAGLESKNELLSTQLLKFDKDKSDQEESQNTMEGLKAQIFDFASKQGKEVKSLEEANDFVLNYLKLGTQGHFLSRSIYDLKGLKKESPIYALGHVAYYSAEGEDYQLLSSQGAGAQAEGGELYLTEQTVPKEVFSDSSKISSASVSFIGSPLTKEKSFKTLFKEKLRDGGAVGYIIILLGLFALAVAFLRYSYIGKFSDYKEEEIRDLVREIQEGRIESAKSKLEGQRTNVFNHFIELLLSYRNKSEEEYESLVLDEINKVHKKVSRFGPVLLVLAGVAPLLGLLGTVTGMIETFQMITVHGTGNPKLLSGGIQAALVTTQMGLVVAIPCILIGNYLSAKAGKVISHFEELASIIPKRS